MIKVKLVWIAFVIVVVGCSVNSSKQDKLELIVAVVEPDRIRFAGKGAGAGMMLMSSMGPMGIAIGVAIDEGIGKDIDENARSLDFDMREIFSAALQQQWQRAAQKSVSKNFDNTMSVTIERYGFITQAGENDPVAPQLHVTLGERTLKFPEDFASRSTIPTAPLAKVKTDAQLVRSLYEQASAIVSESLIISQTE